MIKYSRWESGYRCTECKGDMTRHEKMYSQGVCPTCGHISFSTVCSTEQYSYRYRWHRPDGILWAVLDWLMLYERRYRREERVK
jgi:DNA-directed RNA polymerase subunit RPC12/RpoP